MQFRFINELGLNIQPLNLEVLLKDTNPYSTLLYQPVSVFHPTANKFGNAEGTNCAGKCLDFLRIAKNEHVALTVTPEYSCPWAVVKEIFDEDILPDEGKLWVLGCESITKNDLNTFTQEYADGSLIIHYENAVMQRDGNFLDPVCYILKVRDVDGTPKTLLLIQFKTQHMGVRRSVIENESYIPGEVIYILKNNNISIHLFTLICSEAESFILSLSLEVRNQIYWDNNPYLIIHPQLNPFPKNHIFTNFRHHILSLFDRKEIVSLNWSSLSTLYRVPDPIPFIDYSRSGIYTKHLEIDNTDESRMEENHELGLFYCHHSPFIHAFYLTENVEVFKITNHKPDQTGFAAAMRRRQGPKITALFSWVNNSYQPLANDIDGFADYLDEQGCQSQFLRNTEIDFLDKERLINLSSATIESSENTPWYYIEKLQTLRIDEIETIRRLTFFQDTDTESRNRRNEARNIINSLNTVIIPNAEFPENIAYMQGSCTEVKFDYTVDRDKFKYNLITENGGDKATIAYVGEKENEQVENAFKTLLKLFPEDDNAKRKVTVWFSRGANFYYKNLTLPPRATDDSNTQLDSITTEEK